MKNKMNFPPVDVIIPVYRSLEETQSCLESLWANPQTCTMHVIVINDCSPEPELVAYLNAVAQEKNIQLLHNEENLGFVGTVNRGMALNPTHDVLLLNSDTEVANNWLDKIQKAAYATEKVGSVTPFSNNATICSYPRFCEDNDLPRGWELAELDHLCAQVNPGETVEVPTGVGFCMYIRRDCLNEIGLFDVARFGKGYGEENDFCMRAYYKGWKNLFLLDTFVHHKGGVSFGDSQNPRKQKAMEVLRQLHPSYDQLVLEHIQADPAQKARFMLDLARLKARPIVLFVTHNRGGGTLRHVQEFETLLAATQMNALLLASGENGQAELTFLDQKEALRLYFKLDRDADALIDFLRTIEVCRMHYHHTLDHHPCVLALPEQLACPFDVTIHDYYMVCPQISLTNEQNQYCLEKGEQACAHCLTKNPAPQGVSIQVWRHHALEFLQKAARIFCPSYDVLGRIRKYYPTLSSRLIFTYHFDYLDIQSEEKKLEIQPFLPTSPLKIVVLGALSQIKGADILEATALLAKKMDVPIEFHLLGYGYRHLATQPKSTLIVHGAYQEAALATKLKEIDAHIAWFPARWPETYSYTLSACLAQHLPVVCPNIGAFPERIHGRPWSWVCPWDWQATDWIAFFVQIRMDHFCTGCPPEVFSLPDTCDESDFSYLQDYLTKELYESKQNVFPSENALTTIQYLSTTMFNRRQPFLTLQEKCVSFLRKSVLHVILTLRQSALLRTVMQQVPSGLQRRVKSWLLGNR